MDREPAGTRPDGTPAYAYTLASPSLRCRIIELGAIVTELHVRDRDGVFGDVVLGFDTVEPYLAGHPYFGCIAGRVAGRITAGRFSLDGQTSALALNDPPNHLHGGPEGFDRKWWTVDGGADRWIQLSLVSPDGDQGYPGAVCASVTYSLEGATLRVELHATTDRPGPVNLTFHGYFNLRGEGTVEDHLVQVHADAFAPVDAHRTLLGRRQGVSGRPEDLRALTRLGDRVELLPGSHGPLYFLRGDGVPGTGVEPAARLLEPSTGRVLDVFTTEPVLQLYTGAFLDGSLTGKGGRRYPRFGGCCLEAHRYPDGVNHPGLGDLIIRPDRPYRSVTEYRFSSLA